MLSFVVFINFQGLFGFFRKPGFLHYAISSCLKVFFFWKVHFVLLLYLILFWGIKFFGMEVIFFPFKHQRNFAVMPN